MSYLIPKQFPEAIAPLKAFNGVRRTKEGMLYLSSIDPQLDPSAIATSNFYEDGKSDNVARGETDYIDDRLEMFEVQYFTTDGSSYQYTITTPVLNETRIALFLDGVRQEAYKDYTLVNGTQINLTLIPKTGLSIVAGQIKKRYFNNASDRYQQIKFSANSTTTFLINIDSGDLVQRTNQSVSSVERSALASDDFNIFESATASVNTTSYQSAV